MKKVVVKPENIGKLSAALDETQGKCTARTLTAEKIVNILADIEQKLDIPKNAMAGLPVMARAI